MSGIGRETTHETCKLPIAKHAHVSQSELDKALVHKLHRGAGLERHRCLELHISRQSGPINYEKCHKDTMTQERRKRYPIEEKQEQRGKCDAK